MGVVRRWCPSRVGAEEDVPLLCEVQKLSVIMH